jgi:hypothetical protein
MADIPTAELPSTLQLLISGVVFTVSAVVAALGYFKIGRRDKPEPQAQATILGATLQDNASLNANTRAVIMLTDQVEELASEIRELNRENGRTRDAVRESGDGLRQMVPAIGDLVREIREIRRQ